MTAVFSQGGWLMWPIFIASLVAMGIVIERLWVLRRGSLMPSDIRDSCESVAQSSTAEIDIIAQRGMLGEVFAIALRQGSERSVREEALRQQGQRVAHYLERNLEMLGVIGTVAPLIGLLGTVIGMIDVFGALMLYGAGDASVLAGGIGQALITTASGLVVAIPAIVAHRLLLRRVKALLVELESCCDRFLAASPAQLTRNVARAA